MTILDFRYSLGGGGGGNEKNKGSVKSKDSIRSDNGDNDKKAVASPPPAITISPGEANGNSKQRRYSLAIYVTQ